MQADGYNKAADATERSSESQLFPNRNVTEHAIAQFPQSVVKPLEAQGRGIATEHAFPDHTTTERGIAEDADATQSGDYVLYTDIMGNKVMKLPQSWPLARPGLATRETRIQRAELRIGFAWAMQQEQHALGAAVLPPCSWCGLPTGLWCDLCTKAVANAVCSVCASGWAPYDVCRQCDYRPRC